MRRYQIDSGPRLGAKRKDAGYGPQGETFMDTASFPSMVGLEERIGLRTLSSSENRKPVLFSTIYAETARALTLLT
jgi:hypothetical protein